MSPNETLIASETREAHKQIRRAVELLTTIRHALHNAATDATDTHAQAVLNAAGLEISDAWTKALNAIELTAGLLKPPRRKAGGR